MLPDFPKVKRKWLNQFVSLVEKKITHGTILSKIRRVKHFEGDGMEVIRSSGESDRSAYQEFSHIIEVKRQDVIKRGPLAFFETTDSVALKFRQEQLDMIRSQIIESTSRTGNTVNAHGKEFSFEHILESFEKIEIEFDKRGFPILPDFLPTGIDVNTLIRKVQEWENDPECMRKFNELILRKKQAWLVRESHRKLVD